MAVQEILQQRLEHGELHQIIELLDSPFDSHAFIQRFSKENQGEYLEMLQIYSEKAHPFRIVHAEIAKFLSKNEEILRIQKMGKTRGPNIFGSKTPNEKWGRL